MSSGSTPKCPGTTAPPASSNLPLKPPSGTARANRPFSYAGCWCETQKAPSIPRPSSAPIRRRTRPRSWSGLSGVGPPLAESHLPRSAHASGHGDPAPVVRPGHCPHHLTRTQFVIARSKATRQSRWLAGNSSFGEIAASATGGLAMTVLTKVGTHEVGQALHPDRFRAKIPHLLTKRLVRRRFC